MNQEIEPYRPHLVLVDEETGKVIGEKRAKLIPGEREYLHKA